MATDQYEVLGDSPGPEELENLSPNDLHLRINSASSSTTSLNVKDELVILLLYIEILAVCLVCLKMEISFIINI